jgi:hypothetical protein
VAFHLWDRGCPLKTASFFGLFHFEPEFVPELWGVSLTFTVFHFGDFTASHKSRRIVQVN